MTFLYKTIWFKTTRNDIFVVPQGLILEPSLFLIYGNDLQNASKTLDPINMFAYDPNLFHAHQDIKYYFFYRKYRTEKKSNNSLKFSLNVKKTKYTLFHDNSSKDNTPLKLPDLKIENLINEKNSSIKFLQVILAEQINWRDYIRTVVCKIAKNIGLLHRARQVLNEASLKTIYSSCIHLHLNMQTLHGPVTMLQN